MTPFVMGCFDRWKFGHRRQRTSSPPGARTPTLVLGWTAYPTLEAEQLRGLIPAPRANRVLPVALEVVVAVAESVPLLALEWQLSHRQMVDQTFSASDLASFAGLAGHDVSAALRFLSTRWRIHWGALHGLPDRRAPTAHRSLLEVADGRYLDVGGAAADGSLRLVLEEDIAARGKWQAYEPVRAKFSEQEAARPLRSVVHPHAECSAFNYATGDPANPIGEVDAVMLAGDTAFVVEARVAPCDPPPGGVQVRVERPQEWTR